MTIYLIGIHVFLAIVLLKSNFIDRVERKIGILMAAQSPDITTHFHRMLSYHQRMDANLPEGAVIIIGDGLQGLCVSAIASPTANYGIGSDTTVGVRERLPNYNAIKRARAVVLAIRINDIRRHRPIDEILVN